MKKLYKFFWDCRRQGEVEGLFIADEKDVKVAIGNQVYFGEILGKHSEVYGTLDMCDLTILDIPEHVLDTLEDAIGSRTISGYNPLSYVRFLCSQCGDNFSDEDTEWVFDEDDNRYCGCCWDERVAVLRG